jgi:hypothetical protein
MVKVIDLDVIFPDPWLQVVSVSFDDDSIHLPLEGGPFHVHLQLPSSIIRISIMRQLGPIVLRRRHWVARLLGLHHYPGTDHGSTAISHVCNISNQLSMLVFGAEARVEGPEVRFDGDIDWDFAGDSVVHFTFARGGNDSDDGRALVFRANEELAQGKIHLTGRELRGRDITNWKVRWRELEANPEVDKELTRLHGWYDTPLKRKVRIKNIALQKCFMDEEPGGLEEKVSFERSVDSLGLKAAGRSSGRLWCFMG